MTAIQDAIQTPAMTRRLQGAIGGLIRDHPDVRWRHDLTSSMYFPFQYYVAAMCGPAPDADEVLVISVECFDSRDETGERLIVSADITGENGLLLAEGPRVVVDVPPEAVVLRYPGGIAAAITNPIQAATEGIVQWIESQSVTINRALEQGAV